MKITREISDAIRMAIEVFGSKEELARRCGVSAGFLWYLLSGNVVEVEDLVWNKMRSVLRPYLRSENQIPLALMQNAYVPCLTVGLRGAAVKIILNSSALCDLISNHIGTIFRLEAIRHTNERIALGIDPETKQVFAEVNIRSLTDEEARAVDKASVELNKKNAKPAGVRK